MPVAFDAVTDSKTTSSSTLSFSHTTSGSDRVLIVWVSPYPSVNQSGPTVSSVTYGGTAMTLEGDFTDNFTGDESHVYCYSLLNPASGANTVAITLSAAATDLYAAAISFTGAVSVGTLQTNVGTDNTPTVNVSSQADDLVTDFATAFDRTGTVGSGQTSRKEVEAGANTQFFGISTEPGAATVTMSWTLSSSQNWGIGAINIVAPHSFTLPVDKGDLTLTGRTSTFDADMAVTKGDLSLGGKVVTLSGIVVTTVPGVPDGTFDDNNKTL